jgi:hypothetical protein
MLSLDGSSFQNEITSFVFLSFRDTHLTAATLGSAPPGQITLHCANLSEKSHSRSKLPQLR